RPGELRDICTFSGARTWRQVAVIWASWWKAFGKLTSYWTGASGPGSRSPCARAAVAASASAAAPMSARPSGGRIRSILMRSPRRSRGGRLIGRLGVRRNGRVEAYAVDDVQEYGRDRSVADPGRDRAEGRGGQHPEPDQHAATAAALDDRLQLGVVVVARRRGRQHRDERQGIEAAAGGDEADAQTAQRM